jgi:hypothetical protein
MDEERQGEAAGGVGPTVARWARAAEEEQFTALARVRAAAEKWAGTIGALTGIFTIAAFVKGNDEIAELTQPTQYAVVITVAAALLCAFLAIYFAALAAQGVPVYFSADENPANDPVAYWEHYQDEVRKAAKQLRLSRFLVIPATLLLAIAVGIMWFGPTEQTISATNALVTQKTGTVVCGELVGGNETLKIKTGPTSSPVELVNVAALDVIAACP